MNPSICQTITSLLNVTFQCNEIQNCGIITVLLLTNFILRPYLVDVSLMSVRIYEKDIIYLRKIQNIHRVSISFILVQRL